MLFRNLGVPELIVLLCCPSALLSAAVGVIVWLTTRKKKN